MNHAQRLNQIIEEYTNPATLPDSARGISVVSKSVSGLIVLSHQIEDYTTRPGTDSFRLFTSFQLLSRFTVQAERYRRIAATGNPVYIYGVPDKPVSPVPGLTTLPLAAPATTTDYRDNLAALWWVVLEVPGGLSAALLARQLPPETTSNATRRYYRGFSTFERRVISQIVHVLEDYNATLVQATPVQ